MIRLQDGAIWLEGRCPVEDAEPLLSLLQEGSASALDLGECVSMHTAVLQLLLACPLPLRCGPADPVLAAVLGQRERILEARATGV